MFFKKSDIQVKFFNNKISVFSVNHKTELNKSTFMFSGVFDSVHLGCSVVCQFKALHVKSSAPHILQMPAALFKPAAALLHLRPRNHHLLSGYECILSMLLIHVLLHHRSDFPLQMELTENKWFNNSFTHQNEFTCCCQYQSACENTLNAVTQQVNTHCGGLDVM